MVGRRAGRRQSCVRCEVALKRVVLACSVCNVARARYVGAINCTKVPGQHPEAEIAYIPVVLNGLNGTLVHDVPPPISQWRRRLVASRLAHLVVQAGATQLGAGRRGRLAT